MGFPGEQPKQMILTTAGWLTVVGWQVASASVAYLAGTLMQGLITLNYPSYQAKLWQGTLFNWAVILITVAVNTAVVSSLPQIEGLILVLHVLGFFAILIPVVYLCEPIPAADVFSVFLDLENWNSQTLSFLIGVTGPALSFLGTCCPPRPRPQADIRTKGTDGAIHVRHDSFRFSTMAIEFLL